MKEFIPVISVILGKDCFRECEEGFQFLLKNRAEITSVLPLLSGCDPVKLQEFIKKSVEVGVNVFLVVADGSIYDVAPEISRYVRNSLRNNRVYVIGVAFDLDVVMENTHDRNVISQLDDTCFVGGTGFLGACQMVMEGNLPIPKELKPFVSFFEQGMSLSDALKKARS